MTVATWLLAACLTGWAASYFLTNSRREAIAFNIAVAVPGAVAAGWAVAPALGVPPGFGLFALFVSALGAAAGLFCVHFVQQTVTR
jgi:uncharacterized membrane protein YeaQ/YmgE (transglycosylase-associated protein family)